MICRVCMKSLLTFGFLQNCLDMDMNQVSFQVKDVCYETIKLK